MGAVNASTSAGVTRAGYRLGVTGGPARGDADAAPSRGSARVGPSHEPDGDASNTSSSSVAPLIASAARPERATERP